MSMLATLRHLRQIFNRRKSRPIQLSRPDSAPSAQVEDELIEEEQLPSDRLEQFYPTHPNQVLDGRFKTVVKLGFGAGSTVWLAEN